MEQLASAPTQILGHLSDIPWGCLKCILSSVPLYEACCLGSTSSQHRDAVIRAGTTMPITQALVRQRPGELITPRFRRMLSILLEYHLPASCPHAAVMFQWHEHSLTFCCKACRGFLRFREGKALPLLLPMAFTTSMADQGIKLACMKIINSPANPAVGTNTPPRGGRPGPSLINEKLGHVEELVLKLVTPALPPPPNPAKATWEPICTCDVCNMSRGGDISGDEFAMAGGRLGRRKGRRGNRSSRVMQVSTRVCPNANHTD